MNNTDIPFSLPGFITIVVLSVLTAFLPGCKQADVNTTEPEISFCAESFDLSNVRLLDGPFRDAMERNADYLLSLESDRFLAWFRKEAGLKPKAKVYGGWESEGYVLSGHSLGHHLSALAKQYRATGDERFGERVSYIVSELAEIQIAHGDGYVAAIPDGRQVFEEISRGVIRPDGFSLNNSNVPWYNLDKTFRGLTDAYLLANNNQALEVVVNLAEWAYETTRNLTPEQWQEMLSVEVGGMKHVLADLYAITGNSMHLELAMKFHHTAVMDPLAERRDELAGLHANTQIPKVRGSARIHELTGDPEHRTIATFFWNQVVNFHSYVNGGNSHEEYFGQPGKLSSRLNDTAETCNTHNMLWLTRYLFSWKPRGELMDYYERALLNHILASQHPETGMVKYKGYLDMPARKYFSHPTDSWWCCVGTGMENHTIYGRDIYHHSGDSIFVNLFIASELEWADKDVRLRQETGFPVEEETLLTVSTDGPEELSLLIRKPAWWGGNPEIMVNGSPGETAGTKDGYIEIRRTFEDGDRIEINMPMELRIESMPDNPERIAFLYGPVLLNAVLDESPDSNTSGEDPSVPKLTGSYEELLDALKPVADKPHHFRADGIGTVRNDDTGDWEPVDLYFKPHFRTADELFTVYLDIM